MKRAPFAVAATGVGLGLLFSFHTKPIHVDETSSAGPASTATGSTGTGNSTATSGSSASGSGSAASSTTTAATKSATGEDVQYRYGDIQLRVTEQGSRITSIRILSDGAPDPRSEQINSEAVPTLQSESLAAQSTQIDAVSGATFTSEAYVQALQSALDKLD